VSLAPQQAVSAWDQRPEEDIYGFIGSGEFSERNARFEPGNYSILELQNIFIKNGGQKDLQRRIILECRVFETTSPVPVGTVIGFVWNLDKSKYPKSTAGEIRAAVAALANVAIEQVDRDALKLAVPDSKENRVSPLAGRLFTALCSPGKPRTDGGQPFNPVKFGPLPGSDAEHKHIAVQMAEKFGLTPF
jgi:hypothetical protein